MVSLAAGSRIAGYRLRERIGQGGMAVVFLAHDEQLNRPVALKILAPTLAGDEGFRLRFISESRAAATIDDPHIVPVFAAGEADGILFIAMRYVAGGDARSMLGRDGPLPPGRVADIISPVASALDAAHRAGLVHRDVKPSNMLMDVRPGRPDHVYLSDFGLSKPVAATSGVTAAGAVIGTLAYMSPEQVGSKPADGRADQYALACSAFELLAGTPPFRGDEPAALMYAHLSASPPPLTSRRPGLPPAVDGVLSRALAKAPEDRYASCGQFADTLRDAFGFAPHRSGPAALLSPAAAPAADVGQLPAGDGGRARPRSRRRLRRRIAVAAGIVAAAGLAAGLLLASLAPAMTVPISPKSALPPVSGDVYVVYLGGGHAGAEVYGQIDKAANGEVAELYAQQFPYKNAPRRAGSTVLHPAGTTARYEFRVTPTLATRYRVELFRDSTSSAPLATSGVATIYVIMSATTSSPQDCGRPVCHESVQTTYLSPPSALPTEISKAPYPYFGLNLAPTGTPAVPEWLSLRGGHSHFIGSQQLSADEFIETVTFSPDIGHHDAYHWAWTMCFKDTEAEDGIGLPGHHGCGDQRVLSSASYLG
jgi:serine/threonine-protein kinase